MTRTELHIVSGKGGTGKTTVAAALAIALASGGRKVLLCEVEGRQGIARLLDVDPLPYEERRVSVGLDGGEVYALAIDPESALLEYLQMFYRLGRAGRALDRFGVIDFATTIAPGVRDVLLTGKVYEAAGRDGQDGYDAIVMDAPPTGRIARFLNVNSEVAGLAKAGPIRRQADSIMEMMRAPTTRVHLVSVLEEMPVQETLDGIAELRDTGLPVGHVILNLVRSDLVSAGTATALADGSLDADAVASALRSVSVPADAAPALVVGGREQVERQQLQADQRAVIAGSDRPIIELPYLPDGIDLGSLFDLARSLREDLLEAGAA
ncbi:ArsA-related P-loop ATPase [Aeromicrobium halocynthiae]|uniref:ArsA-related P-loop ATPase n=1 Tax=Aeromicrobium halocynthiae TaxID=560557 RepID=A0ABP5HLJ0_9ACTN